jgi:hypothetical protein
MTTKFNINNLESENRTTPILFATHEFIIYRDQNKIVLASCSGTILSETIVKCDCSNYQYLDLHDAVLFIFNGTTVLLIDKDGMLPLQHMLNPMNMGKCITPLFQWGENQIIFGTKHIGQIQFIAYDFVAEQRITQTASQEADIVKDLYFDQEFGILYALLDNSMLVAYNMKTGEKLWNKFETAKINRGILLYNGDLYYSAQEMIKKTDGKRIEAIRIPLVNVSSLEYSVGRNIYLTANNHKNICCFDAMTKTLVWQIHGHDFLLGSLPVMSTDGSEKLLVYAKNYLSFIDLNKGQSESIIRSQNIVKAHQTEDHLLVQKSSNETLLIPAMRDQEDVGSDTF